VRIKEAETMRREKGLISSWQGSGSSSDVFSV
jgi:hypothetical protein